MVQCPKQYIEKNLNSRYAQYTIQIKSETHTKQYYMLLWMHIYVGKNFKTGIGIQTPEPGLWFPWGRETWGPPALCKAKMA